MKIRHPNRRTALTAIHEVRDMTIEDKDGDEEDDFGIWMTTENDYGGRMTINYGEMDDYGEEPV